MNPEKRRELDERKAACPDEDWSQAEQWIERSLELSRPGGIVSLVLPDGLPFVARKEGPDDGWA